MTDEAISPDGIAAAVLLVVLVILKRPRRL